MKTILLPSEKHVAAFIKEGQSSFNMQVYLYQAQLHDVKKNEITISHSETAMKLHS